MGEEEGAAPPQPKRYRLVSPPQEQAPNTAGKADRAMSGKEVADDYSNAVGQGLTKGMFHTAGAFGDARNLQNSIVNWGAEKLGASPETAQMISKGLQYANPLTAFAPSSDQLMPQAVKDAPRPRTTGARIVETAADMAPQMMMGPGGALRKGLQTGATAAATELGGTGAGLATALLTGGKGGLRERRVPNEHLVQQARQAKTAAYQATEQAGVRYSPQAFDGLVNEVGAALAQGGVNQMRHPRAVSMYQDMDKLRGQSPSLTELDQLRQVVARDVAGATDQAERHFGKIMMGKIDEFVDVADPSMVTAGDPQQAAQLIRAAREANQRYRKLETVTNAVTKAERRAASTGSGGNADNQIRQNIRGIMDSERKSRGFSSDELGKMDEVVRGTKTQNALRLAGKLSPQGNGLMAALGLGGVMASPAFAGPALLAGAVAKPLAERMTRKKVDALIEALAGKSVQTANPRRKEALVQMLLGGGAVTRTGE